MWRRKRIEDFQGQLIGFLPWNLRGEGSTAWLLVTLVGLVATLIESLIGATLQGRIDWLSNELVNGLQTLIAALLAIGLAGLLRIA